MVYHKLHKLFYHLSHFIYHNPSFMPSNYFSFHLPVFPQLNGWHFLCIHHPYNPLLSDVSALHQGLRDVVDIHTIEFDFGIILGCQFFQFRLQIYAFPTPSSHPINDDRLGELLSPGQNLIKLVTIFDGLHLYNIGSSHIWPKSLYSKVPLLRLPPLSSSPINSKPRRP